MKIRMNCSIGYADAKHYDEIEIPDEELAGKSEEEKEEYIEEEYLIPFANQYLEMWYEEVE